MTGSTTTPRPTRTYQRGDLDCLRAALASLLGLRLDETPDAEPGNGVLFDLWEAWARQRGLTLRLHEKDQLPVGREFWVAGVSVAVAGAMRAQAVGPAKFHAHNRHAVVMSYGELWHDPVGWDDPEHHRLMREAAEFAFGVTFDPLDVADEFDRACGALSGKTAPVGGLWAGAGDADDFTVETIGKTAQRTAVSDVDANTGRYAVSGVAPFAAQVVQVDLKHSAIFGISASGAPLAYQGVLARYTDVNNWLMATYSPAFESTTGATEDASVQVRKRVAGTVTTLANVDVTDSAYQSFHSIRLTVDAAGRWQVWLWRVGAAPVKVAGGSDSALATGGALASGKPGVYDAQTAGTANTRNYDNFMSFVPTADAAVFAGQSLEVRHNDTIREDSTGTYWGRPQSYRGSRFFLPPAGDDDLTSRVVVMARRNNIEEMAEANVTDSTTVQIAYVPRWLVAPRQ